MPTIDIALPDELMQALSPPACLELPQLGTASVTLPTGVSLQGMADFTRGIPTDCSMQFNLILQLAPLMGSMECLLRVLKFIGVVIGLLKNISSPLDLVTAVGKIVTAADDMLQCVGIAIPGIPICTFLKGLLTLISTMLICVSQELGSVLRILSGLSIQISAAQASGNSDLLVSLNCAKQNAATSADATMQSIQPVMVLLTLAGTFMELAGQSINVTIPSAVSSGDLQAMQTLVDDLGTVATVIKKVADALPC
jgi:hypothetical protein